MVQEGFYYTKEHEWAKIDGDTATVGITDHAQQALGEITFVELPPLDKKVAQNGELAVVESSKAASDVYSPLDGTVTAMNTELQSRPELINQACYGAGWIAKLRITNTKNVENLMNAKQYEQYLTELK